jgi:hypothetical protein
MNKIHTWRTVLFSDLGILILLALVKILLHMLTNNQYGFHRDELDMIDSARQMDWSYVAYPPVTPFIARVALELFGTSMVGLRFFVALALSILTRGRGYYLGPAYPMLFAGWAVWGEKWLSSLAAGGARLVRWITWSALALGSFFGIALCLPIAPVNSPL